MKDNTTYLNEEDEELTSPRSKINEERKNRPHQGQKWVQTMSTTHQKKLVLLILSNTKAHEVVDITRNITKTPKSIVQNFNWTYNIID